MKKPPRHETLVIIKCSALSLSSSQQPRNSFNVEISHFPPCHFHYVCISNGMLNTLSVYLLCLRYWRCVIATCSEVYVLISAAVISPVVCPTWESLRQWVKTGDYRQEQWWHRATIWWQDIFPTTTMSPVSPRHLQVYQNKLEGRSVCIQYVCVCLFMYQYIWSATTCCFQHMVNSQNSHNAKVCE